MVGLRVDAELYGMLGVYRTEVRPFDEREAILNAFAEQAAIALQRQTVQRPQCGVGAADRDGRGAAADQRASGRARTVLQGILAQARKLCDADQGHVILMGDDDTVTIAADDYPTDPSRAVSFRPSRHFMASISR